MTTTDTGRLGEAKVASRLVELGWYPFVDLSGKCPVDMVAWKDGVAVTIQVKSCMAPQPEGHYEIQVGSIRPNRTTNVIKKFDKAGVDYLAVYLCQDDTVCFLPSQEVPGRSMRLGGNSKRDIESYSNLGG